MFSIDQLGLIKENIEGVIIKERLLYTDVYGIIDNYITGNSSEKNKKNVIMIGGLIGLDLLLKRAKSIDHFMYELYTESALFHANEISNLLAAHIKKTKKIYVVRLQTVIAYKVYLIHIDNRPLIHIYAISGATSSFKADVKEQITAFDLIQPILIQFTEKESAYVIPPEIHLIDLYRTLYSPSDAGNWEESVEIESKLFSFMEDRRAILGGADESISPKERLKIQDDVMKEFVYNNSNAILIGEHALSLIYEEEEYDPIQTTSPVINVISFNDIGKDMDKIKSIVKNSLGRNVPVIYVSRGLKIMKDYRIQRVTVKIGNQYGSNFKAIIWRRIAS